MQERRSIEILCPACKKGCLPPTLVFAGKVKCADCDASFETKNGVIDLLPTFSPRRSRAQALMEWEPIIRIYESRWWRRSSLFAVFTGIPFDREYEVIAQVAKLEGDEVMLDLACGPGIYSRPFAQKLSRGYIVGLDLSEPMLDYASSRARDQGLDNLLFIHGNAQELPFPDNEFDVVNCCGAIHLFPDLPRALSEIRRVLKPGGCFTTAAFRNWLPGESSKKFSKWYFQRVGIYHFRPDELEALLKQAGLNNVECHHAKRYWLIMSAVKPM